MSTTPLTDAFAAPNRGLGTGYYQALAFARVLEGRLVGAETALLNLYRAVESEHHARDAFEAARAMSMGDDCTDEQESAFQSTAIALQDATAGLAQAQNEAHTILNTP